MGHGLVSIGRLAVVTNDVGAAFGETEILAEPEMIDLPQGVAPTVWRWTIGYRVNNTPMSESDIVAPPTITADRHKEFLEPIRATTTFDTARITKHANAIDGYHDTLFDNETDAIALANNLLTLFTKDFQMFRVSLGMSGYRVKLNDPVRIIFPRYGLDNGRDGRVVSLDAQGRRVDITVMV